MRDARYTLGVEGSKIRTAGWLGGASSPSAAELRTGEELIDAHLQQRIHMQLGTPLVSGTAAVGQDLMADHADSPIAPPSARRTLWHPTFGTFAYQWFADGKPIAGATDQTLRVTSALTGKRLSYRVTASADGFASATAMSLATPRVTKPIATTVRGMEWPGEKMTLSHGAWPAGTTLSYQWLMGGKSIAGATGKTLVVPFDGGGITLSALVLAKRAGYETVAYSTQRGQVGAGMVHRLRIISAVASEFPSAQANGTLRGYVEGVDTSNVTLADARVRVYSTGTGIASTKLTFVKEVRTDKAGGFAVTGLAPGSYCTMVTSPDSRYASMDSCREDLVWFGVRVFAGAESDASVALRPPATLRGTVSASNGSKVSGATVNVYRHYVNASGTLSLHKVASARTDSVGRYSFAGLEANYFAIEFTGPSTQSHKTAWWVHDPGSMSSTPTQRSAGGVSLEGKKTTTANMTLPAYLPIGIPKIKGTARVGGTLTASHPKTSGAKYTYQWYANGAKIKGATAQKLTVAKGVRGKAITVKVVGKRSKYATTTRTSAATAKVLLTVAPKVKGTVKVGRTLTASRGTWTSGTSFTYQWYNNGTALPGATKKTYVLKASDRGDRITVKVKGKKKGYATVTRTSAQTPRVAS